MIPFSKLFSWFSPEVIEDHKSAPAIQGVFSAETRERGKLVSSVSGNNIWTLTGREYLTELIALRAANPREVYRQDRVAYIGLGAGAQPEVANIRSLVDPIPYSPGEFLAPLVTPPTFPMSAAAITKTSVRFGREYGLGEISLGFDVVITEAGLFTDGNPDDDWNLTALTGLQASGDRAPVAYKKFEPITKTSNYTLRVVWEVRFI